MAEAGQSFELAPPRFCVVTYMTERECAGLSSLVCSEARATAHS